MLLEAIYHKPQENYAFVSEDNMLCIRIKTKKDDISNVSIFHNDPYIWGEDNNGHFNWIEKENSMVKRGSDKLFDYWEAYIDNDGKRFCYYFKIQNENDTIFYTERGYHNSKPNNQRYYFKFPYLHITDSLVTPKWVEDTVWYQIFPDRFYNEQLVKQNNGADWYQEPTQELILGGNIEGILKKIEYLKELGINGIYLNPIFKSSSNHKYDTIDYYEIDTMFGDKQTLKKLIDVCHKNNIKVMLDAVFNHCGFHSEIFQDVVKNGEKSQFKDWFYIRKFPVSTNPLNYETFAFTYEMPKFNTSNPETRKYLLDVAKYWITEFDIDGWRLDVANEVEHNFWRDFRKEVKAMKPELYIVGEIWHDASKWLQGDQFDSVMNYPFTNAVLDLFVNKNISINEFKEEMNKLYFSYPHMVHSASFNLLGSHDTQRIATLCNNNMNVLKLLFLFQLTYTGSPCIYYGDEIGLEGGEGDPQFRRPMIWNNNKTQNELFEFVKRLISLRKNNLVLANNGEYNILDSKYKNVLVYCRKNENESIFIIINNGELNIDYLIDKDMFDLWNDEFFIKDTNINLPSKGFLILKEV